MVSQIEDPKYTVGEVAAALNVPLATLRTWSGSERPERPSLPSTQPEAGSWRLFSLLDVVHLAAFGALRAHEGAIDSAKIMDEAARSQPGIWRKAVDGARLDAPGLLAGGAESLPEAPRKHLLVFVARFGDRSDIDVDLWYDDATCWNAVAAQMREFFDDPAVGCQLGGSRVARLFRRSAAVYDIWPVILAALAALPQGGATHG